MNKERYYYQSTGNGKYIRIPFNEDWHKKSQNMQQRRWKKIHDQEKATCGNV